MVNEIEYYRGLTKDTSLTPEQRSLAEAMKTKATLNKMLQFGGVAPGIAAGSMAGHPLAGGAIGTQLYRANNWLWDKAFQKPIQQYNFEQYMYKDGSQPKSKPVQSKPVQPQTSGASGAGVVSNRTASTLENQLSELLASNPTATGEVIQPNQENIQAINDYVSQLRQINQPYINAINSYYGNYNDMLDKARRAQRYWQGIASITGNQNWSKIADNYNPLKAEADKLGLTKQIQEAQAGDVNSINEMMGNLAMAQELGLPPEAAFANKNLLTAMSMKDRDKVKLEIALANNLVKKYGIDRNYARAIAQQAMKNQAALEVANVYIGGGAKPGNLTPSGIAQSNRSIYN